MGACNCINSDSTVQKGELALDGQRMRELSKTYNYLDKQIKGDPKIIFFVKRVQARLRGLITRKRVKASMPTTKNVLDRDNYGKYHFVKSSDIVIITLLNLE